MTPAPDILCIGSVLWDVIGRAPSVMRLGSDVPGRITRLPGGVAMNIAMTLRRFGLTPALLTAIGRDEEGTELLAACRRMGLVTDHVYLSEDLPTDRYLAIEGANGLDRRGGRRPFAGSRGRQDPAPAGRRPARIAPRRPAPVPSRSTAT